ncbi:Ig-like domain-containing protein [Fibrella aquatilis]|uniref:Ig-like domain-containing protein n=1 Tax=Fibrella aquatilis TaxID=2817059 RepID=A0A939JX07_9BACT|nr:hypothetical protein [Fibrella aquatilis]MBO0932467.1 hypothetical protein [Fibrella aquatilis]
MKTIIALTITLSLLIPWRLAAQQYPTTTPDALPFSTICQGAAVDFNATVIDDGRQNGKYLVGLYSPALPNGLRIVENVGTYTGVVSTRTAGVNSATNRIRVQFTMPRTLTAGSGYYIQLFGMNFEKSVPAQSTTFTIKPLTTLTISGNPTITAGTPAPINFTFTGTPPFTVDYNDYSSEYASVGFLRSNQTFNAYTATVTPRMPTFDVQRNYDNVFVRNLRDASGCPGPNTVGGSATVTSTPLELTTFLDKSAVCAGGTLNAQYATGNSSIRLQSDFKPLVQLSDASGNFGNPIDLATGVQGTATTNVTIPGNVAAGNGYRIRIISPRADYNALISPRSAAVTITKADKPIVTNTNPTVCQGDPSVTLSATGSGTLRWYDFNGTLQPGAPTQGTGSAGDYGYWVKQVVGSCESDKVDITVKVKTRPGAPSVSPKEICQNGPSYTLEAGGSNLRWYNSSDALWNGNGSTPVVSTGSAGPQTFKVDQQKDGCYSDKATVTVTVNALPGKPGVNNPGAVCQYTDVPNLTASGNGLKWYTAATGGSGQNTIKPNSDQPGTTSYWVSQSDKGCEGPRAQVDQVINPASPDPVTSTVTLCKDQQASSLTANGQNLIWYDANNNKLGAAPTPPTNQVRDIIYRVTQTSNAANCESKKVDLKVEVKDRPGAPVVATISACHNATAPVLSAQGTGFLWYLAATGGNGTESPPPVSTAQVGDQSYWVSQRFGACEGPRAQLTVKIIALPDQPVVVPPAPICQSVSVPTLTAKGQDLRWYRAKTGGNAEGAITPASDNAGTTSFWVSQYVNGCEGPRAQIDQVINPASPDPTFTTNPVLLCKDQQTTPLAAGGQGLKWYNANSNTPLASAPTPPTNQTGDFKYRVSQTSNAFNCESKKVDLLVQVRNTPGAPGVVPVSLCQNQTPKSLTAAGDGLLWYDVETAGTSQTALTPQTVTLGEKAYWVSQRFGSCEGPRAKLLTTVFAVPAAPVAAGKDFCINDPSTALIAAGDALRWYTTADRSTPAQASITPPTDKSQNLTYYVTQTRNGCESATTAVAVRVRAKAVAKLTGDDTVLAYDSTAIRINLEGDGPWSFTLWSGQSITTSNKLFVKWETPNPTAATATYKLQALRNDCGTGDVGNTYTLRIQQPLATQPDPNSTLSLLAYPSPAANRVTLSWQAPAGVGVTLRLVTLLGRVGWQAQRTGTGFGQKEEVDLSTFATGHLFFDIQTTDNQRKTSSLLKQ